MELFDTHTHMYLDAFADDREACLDRAAQAGVRRMALPNIDSASISALKGMMQAYPDRVIGMMGLHPCSVGENWQGELQSIEAELRSGQYHAVGEIGMDLYWDKTFKEAQVKAFEIQIGWAKEMGLPIVIHARDSFSEICEVLDRLHDTSLHGIFHCFSGNEDDAQRALGYSGFYLGIGGVVTFKNGGLDRVLPGIDPARVVLETDAPYLSPVPFRGKRNETAYTRLVAERCAELWQMSLEEVATITTANAENIFKLHVH